MKDYIFASVISAIKPSWNYSICHSQTAKAGGERAIIPGALLSALAAFFIFVLFPLAEIQAQERFTVQSGGRGIENAKQAAQIRQIQVKDDQQDSRLNAVESDIDKIAAHAWKTLSQCGIGSGAGGTGYKITWNPSGSGSWGCIQETDPTVKTFAKTNLPTCGAGQVLRADGTRLICTTSAGSSGFEVDPYVQDFARNTAYTISACASDEVLTMTNKRLTCVKTKNLSITETDPTVQAFAKSALPSCAASQVLTTATNTSGVRVLKCVTDTDGGYAETDPKIGTITNSKWCIGSGSKVVCNQNTPVMTESDPQVGTLTNGRWCTTNGTTINCTTAAPVLTESDPQVGTLTNGRWCTTNGSTINCTSTAPVLSESDPQVGTLTNGRWCTSNGSTVNCTTAAPVTSESDPKVGGLTDGRWCIASGGKVVCNQSTPTASNASCGGSAHGSTESYGDSVCGQCDYGTRVWGNKRCVNGIWAVTSVNFKQCNGNCGGN